MVKKFFFVLMSTFVLLLVSSGDLVAKEYSVLSGFEFELAYNYVGISSGSDFVAVGDWNGNGFEFPLTVKSESSPIGFQFGARWFPFTNNNTGFGFALRGGFATAKMGIDWTSGGGDVDEKNYFGSVGLTGLYKIPIVRPEKRNGIYIIPEAGFEYDFFISEPDDGDEEDNNDRFTISSPAFVLRAVAEVDVADKVGVFAGFEYHVQFAWSASRTFQDESSVSGDLEGSASIWRIVVGASF